MQTGGMSSIEKRATATLVSLFALRMVGLFLLMPVFSVLGESLGGSTPALIGLAIGIYGLTQCLVQVPFGVLSDRWGRKPVIVFGLGLFAVGGVIAALSHGIWGVIVGRGIQGAGAISAAVMALLADLTREENRTKAMATVGLSIGLSFIGALVFGPVLGGLVGLSGVFWITVVLALLGIPVCIWVVPTPVLSGVHRDTKAVPSLLKSVAQDTQLLRLNFGVFVLHMVMTSCFMMLPIALTKEVGVDMAHQWVVYLPALVISFFVMVPFIIVGEKKHKLREVFVFAVGMLAISLVTFALGFHQLWGLYLAMFIFFFAFNLLESIMPSWVSKLAAPGSKGSAMGMFSMAQSLGAAFGGIIGGRLRGAGLGLEECFLVIAVLVAVWFAVAFTMRQPRYLQSFALAIKSLTMDNATAWVDRLLTVPGVEEAVVIVEESTAYLKIDPTKLDRAQLRELAGAY